MSTSRLPTLSFLLAALMTCSCSLLTATAENLRHVDVSENGQRESSKRMAQVVDPENKPQGIIGGTEVDRDNAPGWHVQFISNACGKQKARYQRYFIGWNLTHNYPIAFSLISHLYRFKLAHSYALTLFLLQRIV